MLVVASAYLPDPGGGALSQFGMVFGFPRSSRFAQGFTLASDLDLPLRQFREERTPGPFADQPVDVGNHLKRKGYVGRSTQILGHDLIVT
jgi:hypothetical protein